MKNKLFIILLFLTGCNSNIGEWKTIEISGNIEDDSIKTVIFYPIESIADNLDNFQKIVLANNGEFRINYALNNPINAMIIIGDKQYMLFLEPGKNLSFSYNKTKSIEFLSENKKDNTVLLEYQKRFSPYFSSALKYRLKPEQFVRQVDSITNEKNLFIEQNKNDLSKNFITFIKNDIQYYSAKEKIYFARRYASYLIKEKNNYFTFLDSIKIQNNQASNYWSYLDFTDNYINYLYLKKIWGIGANFKNDFVEKYYIAKSELNGEPLEHFLTANLVSGIDSPYEKEEFTKIVDEFLSGNYSENSKNILRQSLSAYYENSISEGETAPDFSLKNTDNKYYSLKDFEKKFIVLDFWASWCGPCKKAIPEMKIIAEKYKEKAQFCFISIDNNYTSWEKACKQLNVPEPSLLIDSLTRINYGFNKKVSIPFYLVIDSNGEIVLSNTTKEEIISLLENN